MNDNVVIAIIAASAVVISAVCVLGGSIFAFVTSNRRLDRIEMRLGTIETSVNSSTDLLIGKIHEVERKMK